MSTPGCFALLVVSIAFAACASDARVDTPSAQRVDLDGPIALVDTDSLGNLEVRIVDASDAVLVDATWDSELHTLSWIAVDGTSGTRELAQQTPSAFATAWMVHDLWRSSAEQAFSIEGEDLEHSAGDACSWNCMLFTGNSYNHCWCGCHPNERSVARGCPI